MMMSANKIMFSIDPIEQAGLDGGEIWVWDGNNPHSALHIVL